MTAVNRMVVPALDPAGEKGAVTRWLMADSSAVEEGDVVAEVSVGRAETQIIAAASGVLQHAVTERQMSDVGAVLAHIVAPGDGDTAAEFDPAPVAGSPAVGPATVGCRLVEHHLRPGVTAQQVVGAVNSVIAPLVGVVRAREAAAATIDIPALPSSCRIAVGVGEVVERVTVVESATEGRSIGIRPTVTIAFTCVAPEEVNPVARSIATELEKL